MSATPSEFDYAPSRESHEIVALRERYGLFIGGAWSAPSSGIYLPTIDPSNERELAQVARADARDVERALAAARRGYEKYWRKLRPSERAKYLYRIARALGERAREFAILESLDGGKPIREARDFDLPHACAQLFYHAGWADKLEWAVRAPQRARSLGVVGAVVRRQSPLLGAISKVAPALACGNVVVLKPSEATPLAALHLARLCAECDLPPGVLSVLPGDAASGAALAEAPELDLLCFTGSREIGKSVRRATAGTRVRLRLELGGKMAVIVYDDAPLDAAVEGIVAALAFNAGHSAWAGARVLAAESIAADLGERLRERLGSLRHGEPLDRNTDIGPLGSRAQRDRIAAYLRAGVEGGATLVQAPWTPPETGYWCPASFFTGVEPAHRIARDEVVGPVLAILTFRTPDEAIERADNVPYGLAAGIWTSSGALALYTAQRLRAGVVWANTFNRFDPSSPFGGFGESGFGRDGGPVGLRGYLHV